MRQQIHLMGQAASAAKGSNGRPLQAMITVLTIGSEEISAILEHHDLIALTAADTGKGFEQFCALGAQLLLLHLPVADSNDTDLRVRLHDLRSKTPVIAFGPRADGAERIRRPELMADQIATPCSPRELAAQISTILRGPTLSLEQTVCFGDVEVNFERRYIMRRGEEVKMTRTEYNLLEFLLRNADRPLTRDAILNHVWGYDFYPNTRTVDAHIVKLRQKLEPEPTAPRHFLTIHGVGYRFKMNPA